MIYEFISNYLPNYYSRNDVDRLNTLYRYFNDNLTLIEKSKSELEFTPVKRAFNEFVELLDKLFSGSQKQFTNEICNKIQGIVY